MSITMSIIMSMSSIKAVCCHVLMLMMWWLDEVPFSVVHCGAPMPMIISFVTMGVCVSIVCLMIFLLS